MWICIKIDSSFLRFYAYCVMHCMLVLCPGQGGHHRGPHGRPPDDDNAEDLFSNGSKALCPGHHGCMTNGELIFNFLCIEIVCMHVLYAFIVLIWCVLAVCMHGEIERSKMFVRSALILIRRRCPHPPHPTEVLCVDECSVEQHGQPCFVSFVEFAEHL
jgi:hypothetical protein